MIEASITYENILYMERYIYLQTFYRHQESHLYVLQSVYPLTVSITSAFNNYFIKRFKCVYLALYIYFQGYAHSKSAHKGLCVEKMFNAKCRLEKV